MHRLVPCTLPSILRSIPCPVQRCRLPRARHTVLAPLATHAIVGSIHGSKDTRQDAERDSTRTRVRSDFASPFVRNFLPLPSFLSPYFSSHLCSFSSFIFSSNRCTLGVSLSFSLSLSLSLYSLRSIFQSLPERFEFHGLKSTCEITGLIASTLDGPASEDPRP